MYLDKATLMRAIGDLKGTANPLLKVWLTLKAMGLSPSAAVTVDTSNSDPYIKRLFRSGDPSGRFYIPFGSTVSSFWMNRDASRSIIQTTVKKWHDGTITTVDPRSFLKFTKVATRYKVEINSAYPQGLGSWKIGFATKQSVSLAVPMAQFAAWVFCREVIPDDTSDVSGYLCDKLRLLLHLDHNEEICVFAQTPFQIKTSDHVLKENEIFDLCMGRNLTVKRDEMSHQQIRYGAPGTGKSFGLDKETGDDAVVFRTTFHPDSDYSTFVGTYKPTMKGEGTNEKIAYSFRPQTFMNAYVAAWKEYAKGDAGVSLTDRIAKPYTGLNKVMVDVANAFVVEEGKGVVKTRQEIVAKAVELSGGEYMVGSFGPADYCYNRFNVGATFTKPPVFEYLGNSTFKCLGPEDASYSGDIFWRKKSSDVDEVVGHCVNGVRTLNASEPGKKVILAVEEINRGNCAQIFGDLFQLLDREEDGFSTYPIDADADLAKWLSDDDQFGANGLCLEKPTNLKMRDDDWQAVMRGEKLALPPNLYIWATMNTSDQSLFPIDSAFKRRWDWKYVPIAKPDTTSMPDWKDRKIVANGNAYDWWDFITILNGHIADITKSEDKQLGYFFVKAPDATGEITAERFANKVLFYLFNDVFKDWDLPAAIFGKGTLSKGKYAFKDFFYTEKTTVDGKTFMPGDVKEDVVSAFIEKQEDKNHNKVGKASKNPPAPPSVPAPAPAPAPVA